jgi:hypothetical protein
VPLVYFLYINPDSFAKICYLEDKITKTQHFGGILRYFGGKKPMFEKRSDYVFFTFEMFMFFPVLWVRIMILKYFFNLKGYFLITTST